jgi:hypothetical protein
LPGLSLLHPQREGGCRPDEEAKKYFKLSVKPLITTNNPLLVSVTFFPRLNSLLAFQTNLQNYLLSNKPVALNYLWVMNRP